MVWSVVLLGHLFPLIPGAVDTIRLYDYALDPRTVAIGLGDTVVFHNVSSFPYKIQADDGSWSTAYLNPGDSDAIPFSSSGTFPFHDSLRPSIQGTVQVVAQEVIQVTVPASGDVWYAGDTYTIRWNASPTISSVRILLCQGSSCPTTLTSSTPNDGAYAWSIPLNMAPGSYTIRVEKTTDPSVYGVSGVFSIEVPTITVTSPAAGDVWYRGDSYTIQWNAPASISSVRIELLNSGVLEDVITYSTPNDGSFSWLIPSTTIPEGSNYTIRIASTSNTAVAGTSGVFTITDPPPQPAISVTEPTASTVWYRGQDGQIRWDYQGNPGNTVDILLYDGTTYTTTIASGVPIQQRQYTWNVPSTLPVGNTYRVRVRSSQNTSIDDYSPYFSIQDLPMCNTELVLASGVTLYADCIEQDPTDPAVYTAQGNVNINGILLVGGTATYNTVTGELTLTGSIAIPAGADTFTVEFSTATFQVGPNMLDVGSAVLSYLAGLPIQVSRLEFVSGGGVLVAGTIDLQQLGSLALDSLVVDPSGGIVLSLTYSGEIEFHGLTLEELSLGYDQTQDIVEGGVQVSLPILSMEGGIRFLQGALDSIEVLIRPAQPIPLGSTGLFLTEGGGGLSNLHRGPIKIRICAGITGGPQVGSLYILELSGCMALRPPDDLAAEDVTVSLLAVGDVAGGEVRYTTQALDIRFFIDLGDVVQGETEVSFQANDLHGNFQGVIGIPQGLPWYLEFLESVGTLDVEGTFAHNEIRGMITLNLADFGIIMPWEPSLTFAFLLRMTPSGLEKYIGTNYDNLVPVHQSQLRTTELTFNVPPETPRLLVFLRDSVGTSPPPSRLITPSGDTLDTSSTFYGERGNLGLYVIEAPHPGTWRLRIPPSALQGAPQVVLLGEKSWAIPEFVDTVALLPSTSPIRIFSPEDGLCTRISLVPEGYAFPGAFVDTLCLNRGVQTFHLPPFAPGRYRVRMDVNREGVPSSPVISPFVVVFPDSAGLPSPASISLQPADSGIWVMWDTTGMDTSRLLGYKVYYRSLRDTIWRVVSVADDSVRAWVSDVIPGRTYVFRVVGYDGVGNESDTAQAPTDTLMFVRSTGNHAPFIEKAPTRIRALAGQALQESLRVMDQDGDPVTVRLENAPPGMHVQGNLLIWNVPDTSMIRRVGLIAEDGQGGADTVWFLAQALDTLQHRLRLFFDRGTYMTYEDRGRIYLYTSNLPQDADSVQIRVYSDSDTQGITVVLDPVPGRPGMYVGSFAFSPESSRNTSLRVADGDSLTAVYGSSITHARFLAHRVGVQDPEVTPPVTYLPGVWIQRLTPQGVVVRFSLPAPGEVSMELYNVMGRRVFRSIQDVPAAGYHTRVVPLQGMPPGVYLLHTRIADRTFVRKFVWIR